MTDPAAVDPVAREVTELVVTVPARCVAVGTVEIASTHDTIAERSHGIDRCQRWRHVLPDGSRGKYVLRGVTPNQTTRTSWWFKRIKRIHCAWSTTTREWKIRLQVIQLVVNINCCRLIYSVMLSLSTCFCNNRYTFEQCVNMQLRICTVWLILDSLWWVMVELHHSAMPPTNTSHNSTFTYSGL